MPISEFRNAAGSWAKLEAMESGYTVYKMYDYSHITGELVDTKFFYFDSNGNLVKIR